MWVCVTVAVWPCRRSLSLHRVVREFLPYYQRDPSQCGIVATTRVACPSTRYRKDAVVLASACAVSHRPQTSNKQKPPLSCRGNNPSLVSFPRGSTFAVVVFRVVERAGTIALAQQPISSRRFALLRRRGVCARVLEGVKDLSFAAREQTCGTRGRHQSWCCVSRMSRFSLVLGAARRAWCMARSRWRHTRGAPLPCW